MSLEQHERGIHVVFTSRPGRAARDQWSRERSENTGVPGALAAAVPSAKLSPQCQAVPAVPSSPRSAKLSPAASSSPRQRTTPRLQRLAAPIARQPRRAPRQPAPSVARALSLAPTSRSIRLQPWAYRVLYRVCYSIGWSYERPARAARAAHRGAQIRASAARRRSEERRVGKEC